MSGKPAVKPPPSKPSVSGKPAPAAAAADPSGKEALALCKELQEELAKLKKKVSILTSDLDEERAARLKQQVELDRIKKSLD